MIGTRHPSGLALLLCACELAPTELGDAGIDLGADAQAWADAGFDGPELPERPIRCLDYSPATYFHEVTLGRTELVRVTLTNVCRRPLTILSARVVDESGPFTLDPFPLPFTLEAEERVRMSVRFSPLAPVTYEGQVAVVLDDPGQPEIRVRIVGEGVSGELRALPSQLEFPSAPVFCETSSATLALWNEGPGPMYVYSMVLEGPDRDAFSFTTETNLPRDVPAFEGLSVDLDFHPTRAGPHSASLLVTYNGRQSPARVPLSAVAMVDGHREERFVLPARPLHDLVFLVPPDEIDQGEREALRSFLLEVNRNQEIDLRFSVTPGGALDPVLGAPVACAGFPPLVDVTEVEPELLEVLVPCMLSVARFRGSARSSEVLVSALESDAARPPDESARFRVGAEVHAVFTTDYDASRIPLPFVFDFLDALSRPRFPAVFVHGYEFPRPTPSRPNAARHHELIRATSGLFVDPQSAAWPRFFEALRTRMREGPRPVVPSLPIDPDWMTVLDATSGATVSASLDLEGRRFWVPAHVGPELLLRYRPRCF